PPPGGDGRPARPSPGARRSAGTTIRRVPAASPVHPPSSLTAARPVSGNPAGFAAVVRVWVGGGAMGDPGSTESCFHYTTGAWRGQTLPEWAPGVSGRQAHRSGVEAGPA